MRNVEIRHPESVVIPACSHSRGIGQFAAKRAVEGYSLDHTGWIIDIGLPFPIDKLIICSVRKFNQQR